MWELKNKSASIHVQIKAWLDTDQLGADRPTEMAVAGMFQRSDARRYILIHGRLAQDSQEVKTNKSNKPTSKETTHQTCRPPEPFVSLFVSVLLSQRCTYKCVCVCMCVCRVVCSRPLQTFTGVSKNSPALGKESVHWGCRWREG